jgi:hypothetical protein
VSVCRVADQFVDVNKLIGIGSSAIRGLERPIARNVVEILEA